MPAWKFLVYKDCRYIKEREMDYLSLNNSGKSAVYISSSKCISASTSHSAWELERRKVQTKIKSFLLRIFLFALSFEKAVSK